ncbi:MAG: hypothetical protein HC819_06925 [Cyclobacteriaceae bacterium]|nr:hypothetical protein [Cyclobacteriaceae bacterium]
MKLSRLSLIFVLSVALLAGCHVPQFEIAPGNREVQIIHDQYLRSCKFYIPKKLKRKKRSLVLCLHPEGESAESMRRLTRQGFDNLADRDGFIIGYPQAQYGYWNDGREDSISLAHFQNIDDVGYIQRLIRYGIDSFLVDPGQIFIAGLSSGGFMAYRLACELSSEINGIAAVSASLALDQLVECNADTTVSVMVVNGTRDPIMPYDGGQMMVDEQAQGSILSAEETIKYWGGGEPLQS